MVCKIFFCSEFTVQIPHYSGGVVEKKRRREAITKRLAFQAKAKNRRLLFCLFFRICPIIFGWKWAWRMWTIVKYLRFSVRVLLSICSDFLPTSAWRCLYKCCSEKSVYLKRKINSNKQKSQKVCPSICNLCALTKQEFKIRRSFEYVSDFITPL